MVYSTHTRTYQSTYKKLLRYVLSGSILSASAPLLADRVDELETQIKKMDTENKLLIKELKQDNKKSAKRISSLKNQVEQSNERLRINGFMSAYATRAQKDVDLQGLGIDDSWSFRPDTMGAIQMDYKLSDRSTVIMQYTAQGGNDYNLNMAWGYIAYKLTDDFLFRVGRRQSSLYYHSETLDVGFSYPWVRPPVALYVPGISTVEGVGISYTTQFGDWVIVPEMTYGSADFPNRFRAISARNGGSASVSFNNGPLTFRGSYTTAPKVTVEGVAGIFTTEYFTTALVYEDDRWLFFNELSKNSSTGYQMDRLDLLSTLGYKIEKWTPYIAYTHSYSPKRSDDRLRSLLPPGVTQMRWDMKSYELGVRYDLTPRIALKAQVDKYDDFDGTGGLFEVTTDAGLLDTAALEELGDSNMIWSIGADVIF